MVPSKAADGPGGRPGPGPGTMDGASVGGGKGVPAGAPDMVGPSVGPMEGGEAVIGPDGIDPGIAVAGAAVPGRRDPGATHPGALDGALMVPGGAPLGAIAEGNWTRWPRLARGPSTKPADSRTPKMIGVLATGAPEEGPEKGTLPDRPQDKGAFEYHGGRLRSRAVPSGAPMAEG